MGISRLQEPTGWRQDGRVVDLIDSLQGLLWRWDIT